MAEIRTESSEEDLCTLYIGEQVVITGLIRAPGDELGLRLPGLLGSG